MSNSAIGAFNKPKHLVSEILLKKRHNKKDKIDTGANTELYIDGVRIKGATKFTYEVAGHNIAVMTVRIIGRLKAK